MGRVPRLLSPNKRFSECLPAPPEWSFPVSAQSLFESSHLAALL